MDLSIDTPLAMLPLELLMKITSYLDLEDYVNLRASCTRLCISLESDAVCRAYVKDCMNFTIQRTYLTRTRFQLARPYSVIVLGHGQGWFYGEGLLVYALGDIIRVLDVYNAAITEDVIDVRSLLSEEAQRWPQYTQRIQQLLLQDLDIRVLGHGGGILLIGIDDVVSPRGYLLVIDRREGILLQERLLLIRRCYCDLAKTDGRYIIVFEDRRRHSIDLYDLEDKQQGIQNRYLPTDLDFTTADRQIHDGWFYLLIGDKKDYNYCFRFPLKQFPPLATYHAFRTRPLPAGFPLKQYPPLPTNHPFRGRPLPADLQVVRVKRRQRRIQQNCGFDPHDAWSSLKLCRDEFSGQLILIESWYDDSKEDGAANHQYTFQPLQFPEADFAIDTSWSTRQFHNNYVVPTLSPADLPRPQEDHECPRDLSERLKARSYAPKTSTFFDVYLGSGANPDSIKQFEFHLAVFPHRCVPPSEAEAGQLDKVSPKKPCGVSPHDDNEQHLVGVRRFPSIGAPNALTDLLCPTGELKRPITSLHDPHSILYSTKRFHQGLNDTAEQLVLINFDPWLRFPNLKPMTLHPLSTPLTPEEYQNELIWAKQDRDVFTEEDQAKDNKREANRAKMDEMDKAEKEGKVWEPRAQWFWTESAMYLKIKQGFQFS